MFNQMREKSEATHDTWLLVLSTLMAAWMAATSTAQAVTANGIHSLARLGTRTGTFITLRN